MKHRSIKYFFSFFRIRNMGFFFASVLIVLLTANTVLADVWDKLDGYEYQENENVEDYVWKEDGSGIPDYPENNDLLEVEGPAAYRNYQYLIDGKTLLVGGDGVVRYSIVIRSSSGSDNVMFEGLRCNTAQVKIYAYGSTDTQDRKVFTPKANSAWKALRSSGVSGYSDNFAKSYFCDNFGAVLSRNEIIKNIKYGKGSVDGIYN